MDQILFYNCLQWFNIKNAEPFLKAMSDTNTYDYIQTIYRCQRVSVVSGVYWKSSGE